LPDKVGVEPPVFGRVLDRPARAPKPSRERPFQQRLLVDFRKDVFDNASRPLTPDAKRLEAFGHTAASMALDEGVGASGRHGRSPVVERPMAFERTHSVIDVVG
jgi:hypothetical protein